MEVWKIMFLSKWVICRFHVNLPGCIKSWVDLGKSFQLDVLKNFAFFETEFIRG